MRKLVKKIAYVAVLALLSTLGSCNKEADFSEGDYSEGEVDAVLTLNIPGEFASSTKGLTVDQENDIIDVYVYAIDNTNKVVRCAQGEAIGNPAGRTKTFKVSLSSSADLNDKYKLVVIANIGGVLANVPSCLGKTEAEMTKELNAEIPGKMYDGEGVGDAAKKKIVMSGMIAAQVINAQSKLSVVLTRNIARIDVGVGTKNGDVWDNTTIPFKLNSVHVFRPSKKHYFMPVDETTISSIDKFTTSESVSKFAYTDATANGDNKFFLQKIYVPEASILQGETEPGGTNHTNRMALVMGGYYNGSTTLTYYRVDFAKTNTTSSKYELMDVDRNHLYSVSIKGVRDAGYASPEDAYNGNSMNMNVEILNWDYEHMDDIVFDGQNYFSITKKKVQLSPLGNDGPVVLDVRTNVSDWGMKWTTTGNVNGEVFEDNNFKITKKKITNEEYTLTVEAKSHNIAAQGATRTAELAISASRLRTSLVIEQETKSAFVSYPSDMNLKPEGTGNPDNGVPLYIEALTVGNVSITSPKPWLVLEEIINTKINGLTHVKYKIVAKRYMHTEGTEIRDAKISISGDGINSAEVIVTQEYPYITMANAMRFDLNTIKSYTYKIFTNIKDIALIPITTVNPNITLGSPAISDRNITYSIDVKASPAAQVTYELSEVKTAYGFPAQTVVFSIASNATELSWYWTQNYNAPENGLNIPWHEDNISVTIKSAAGWSLDKAKSSADLNIDPSAGGPSIPSGKAYFIKVPRNHTGVDQPKKAYLTNLAGSNDRTITFNHIRQIFEIKSQNHEFVPGKLTDVDTMYISYDRSPGAFTIESNVSWTLSCGSAMWIVLKKDDDYQSIGRTITVDDVTRTKISQKKTSMETKINVNASSFASQFGPVNEPDRYQLISFINESNMADPITTPKDILVYQYSNRFEVLTTFENKIPASGYDGDIEVLTNVLEANLLNAPKSPNYMIASYKSEFLPPAKPKKVNVNAKVLAHWFVSGEDEVDLTVKLYCSEPYGGVTSRINLLTTTWKQDYYTISPQFITHTNGRYDVSTQARGIHFKHGSIIGVLADGTFINPSKVAGINTYTDIPCAGQTEVVNEAYHNAANVKIGKGDPCRLVGLTEAQIQTGSIDNGTWRMMTYAELRGLFQYDYYNITPNSSSVLMLFKERFSSYIPLTFFSETGLIRNTNGYFRADLGAFNMIKPPAGAYGSLTPTPGLDPNIAGHVRCVRQK